MSVPAKRSTAGTRPTKAPNALVTTYLTVYNAGSAVAWGYVLYLLGYHLLKTNGEYTSSYRAVGDLTRSVQTFAILEILHSLFGLVKTPVATTVIQVSSRLLLVWGVLFMFPVPEVTQHWAVSTMIGAWCVAEITRYVYYTFSLVGSVPGWVTWCRYNFFFILYPVGAGSEFILLLLSLKSVRLYDERLYYLYLAIAFTYPPGLYLMYTHMMAQRRKIMRASRAKTA
ncbi:very-long-chain (3R)-3-hydroxyacyl-CoA dehydratase [Powellomyces hirtus]|uniref:Very-long-chain (3R)-3-hydroxyacyl-CoA dehydratase n=1 Tax=Powellomyces hirtus TaxID=109895 RepID=A0A507E5X7_9FUNG|nr:very-long-chain (3R)-3-hydroxyacyl-CoA dehydratase [Powellomyces hirtus]